MKFNLYSCIKLHYSLSYLAFVEVFFIKGKISKKELIKEIGKSIKNEELAAFIGAGLSVDAGFLTWSDLLREPASEIRLDI
ncbi:hypothetical protein [Mycoplasma capricolum]